MDRLNPPREDSSSGPGLLGFLGFVAVVAVIAYAVAHFGYGFNF